VPRAASSGPIGGDASAGHLALGLNDRSDARFDFAVQPRRTVVAVGASFLLQASILVALYFTGRVGPQAIGVSGQTTQASTRVDLVYLVRPGAGGGGGGGGNRTPDPPKRAEGKGRDTITVPVAPTPSVEAKVEPPPLARLDIPVQSTAQGLQDSLGAAQEIGPLTTSRGPGSGDGTGGGRGKGDGNGDGPGVGDGRRGGTGDDYGPGSGATDPVVTVRVDPKYTPEAMLARVQGSVRVSCIVRPTGLCTDARVTRAPDPPYGLDRAALEAVGKWRFLPARKNNQPVSMTVSIELEFSVR